MESSAPHFLVVVSADLLEAGMSAKGGWSKAQLELLGVAWPPAKGWKQAILGTTIPAASAEAFVRLVGRQRL